jgi:PadR family transcriptional regulator
LPLRDADGNVLRVRRARASIDCGAASGVAARTTSSCGHATSGCAILLWRRHMKSKLDLLQGTLDVMVLQTLAALGPLHGYGVARRIEQVSGDAVLLNQGTIYASLVRLQQRGWIKAEWGTSDNNRKAKFYALTRAGHKRLSAETENWSRLSAVMTRILALGDAEER